MNKNPNSNLSKMIKKKKNNTSFLEWDSSFLFEK